MNLQTIPNKPMSMTEVLNHVRTHLLTQNAKSSSVESSLLASSSCLYRYDDLSCAVGCLIPDLNYNKEWEYTGVTDLLDDNESFAALMNQVVDLKHSNVKRLLEALQYIHDSYDVHEWTRMLDSLNGCETWDCDVWIGYMDAMYNDLTNEWVATQGSNTISHGPQSDGDKMFGLDSEFYRTEPYS